MSKNKPDDDQIMKAVWILSDGLPGHYNQSLGLSKALQQQLPHDATIIPVRLKSKLLRPLLRFIANHIPALVNLKTFTAFYHVDPLPPIKPTLIISAGGNTLFANIALSRAYHANNIFSGTVKGYNASLIKLIFTTVPLPDTANNVVLDLPPANISAGSKPGKQGVYTLLIGGDGAGYHFSRADWLVLAESIVHISQRDGVRWNITTSRRTSCAAEQLLRDNIDSSVIAEAVWFADKPRKVVRHFLDEGEIIFCTEDSLTMVAEAIYAHKPVITLQPDSMTPVANDAQALKKYQDNRYIHRTSLKNMSRMVINQADFCTTYPDTNEQIATAVLAL